MAPYLDDDKLRMLAHPWSTQRNEALNNSVASYAPKNKSFCRTTSLKTRVGIASAVMVLGYEGFWTRVFEELKVDMDDNFRTTLRRRDTKKRKKSAKQRSKEGKIRRREKYLAAFTQSHKEQMHDAKTGKTYGSGIALKEAKKQAKERLTAAVRNPKGTKKELLRCPYYHPLYCSKLGHTAASSKDCAMKAKSKEERKIIMHDIKRMVIEEELRDVQENGMLITLCIFVPLINNFSNHI